VTFNTVNIAGGRRLQWIGQLIWKELFEILRKPLVPILVVAASIFVVWTAGKLTAEKPPFEISLYQGDLNDADLGPVMAPLNELPRVRTTVVKRDTARSTINQSGSARVSAVSRFSITDFKQEWLILHDYPTSFQEEMAALTLSGVGKVLNRPQSSLLDLYLSPPESRISSLPRDPQWQLVPGTVALILAFLLFVLAARSYSREVTYGTLPILLVSSAGGWAEILIAKIAASVWSMFVVFLFTLLAVRSYFDLTPKRGLTTEVFVQMLAVFVSTGLGLFGTMVARSQSQVYLFAALYLALVLLSGFLFPLESADPIIRTMSYASPLTFSTKSLEFWLVFGANPLTFWREILYLLAQCVFVTVLLTVGVKIARRRI
jgi:ABC-type multidrug transport system permease subunit